MAVEQTKIIIESLLTGSQFEIAINEHDKVSIVKMNIQKLIGIPSNQLHLLHNQVELNDSTSLKDIPNFQSGIKLKLVLGMKGGPISSSRRVPLTDYDSWFDDVLNQTAKREEPLTIKTTKYLVYKGCKKNVHRLWKMNGGGSGGSNDNNGKGGKSSTTNSKYGKANSLFGGGSGLGRADDDKIKKMTDATIQENIRTTEKINQLRLKMELVNARKKLKSFKFPIKGSSGGSKKLSTMTSDDKEKQVENDVVEKPKTAPPSSIVKTKESEKMIKLRSQVGGGESRDFLTAESKMKIKENLSRNRSFKTILTQPSGITNSSSSMSLFNNEINPLEFCFTGGASTSEISSGSKLGRSLSFQSNYIFNRTDANSSLATMEAATISNSTPIIQEFVETICEPSSATTTTALKELAPKSSYSSASMQDLLLQEFLSKSNKTSSSHFQLTPATQLASNAPSKNLSCGRDFTCSTRQNSPGSALKLTASETDKIDMFKGTAITKLSSPSTVSSASTAVDEYFILPKLLIRDDTSPSVVLENSLDIVQETKSEELLDIAKQPSAESLIEFYENLTSSSTSSLASGKNEFECFHSNPATASNRFYHSDLDLNQLNDRFKNTLSISSQNMNTSEGNLGGGGGERENESSVDCWPRSNLLLLSINQSMKDESTPNSGYNIIEDVNYDKFLNDLLNNSSNDLPPVHFQTPTSLKPANNEDSDKKDESCGSADVTVTSKSKADELIDLFGSTVSKKMPSRRIAPLVKKPIDKLKCFSSNPQLGASTSHYSLKSESSTNLTATATTSTTTVHHIPQLSRLDAIPTKYRRGYINLNDACLSSNSDLSTKMPKTSSDCHRKLSLKDPITSLSNANSSSFHHGASIFHCRSSSSSDQHPPPPPQHSGNAFDCFGSGNNSMSGRQSRFEYCNSYYSNFNQFASASTSAGGAAAAASKNLSKESNLNDFQSEENLFNMNFDSFYEDFVDSSAELSWSSTSSASSTSYDSSSISSMYDKKYVVLPEIKLDNELMRLDKASDEKALMVAAAVKEKEDKDPATSGKLRCYHCNKKLGIIMIMKCHCNQYFCSAHRYKEMHNCSYDFKENGRKKLERENPLVCTQKLPKI